MASTPQTKPGFTTTDERWDLTHFGRPVAWSRAENETCEAGTPGCCIDHALEPTPGSCETW